MLRGVPDALINCEAEVGGVNSENETHGTQ